MLQYHTDTGYTAVKYMVRHQKFFYGKCGNDRSDCKLQS